jgi:hypothetical protein
MTRQADLFNRAADCQRAIEFAANPQQQIAFKLLRDMWTALANECLAMRHDQLAREIAAIEELQSNVVALGKATPA